MLENVDRLLNSPAKQRGRDFAIILSSLSNLGYTVEWRIINAADYGMPQRRRRTYLVAYRQETTLATQFERLGNKFDWILQDGIMPQAFKRIIPPLGNEFIAMLKDSSLVSVIGFEELTRRGQLIIARTYASFEIWMAVAIIYLIMTFAVARFTGYLERRFDTK